MGMPPWHMWGTSQVLNLSASAGAQAPSPLTQQLSRIDYGRPETWRFFFWGDMLQSSVAAGAGGVNLAFDLIIGVGRTQKNVRSFVELGFPIVGTPATDNVLKWTTLARLPPQFGGDTTERTTDLFVSQAIQCSARVTFFAASDTSIQLEVGCLFSPNAHVRPEWFQAADDSRRGVARFRGSENGGM
jgi:hypothetical protein